MCNIFFTEKIERAVEVSMKFSGVDLDETCGDDMDACEEALLDAVSSATGIDPDLITDLRFEAGISRNPWSM